MAKLTDIQLILLTTASQRDDGSLLPPPDSIGEQGERIRKAITALLKRGLVEEAETNSANAIWREDGDLRFTVIITAAGRDVIGAAGDDEQGQQEPVMPTTATSESDVGSDADDGRATEAADTAPKLGSKQSIIIALLKQETGATLKDLEAATGWLPHTTRAALTGLRKKGHTITKEKVDWATRYMIVASA